MVLFPAVAVPALRAPLCRLPSLCLDSSVSEAVRPLTDLDLAFHDLDAVAAEPAIVTLSPVAARRSRSRRAGSLGAGSVGPRPGVSIRMNTVRPSDGTIPQRHASKACAELKGTYHAIVLSSELSLGSHTIYIVSIRRMKRVPS
jgi:hypothetical protein